MGDGPDRLRHREELRIAGLLRAGDVRLCISATTRWNRSCEAKGPKLFYSITGSAAKKRLYLKLVNAESTPQPIDIEISGARLAATAKLVNPQRSRYAGQ